MKTTRRLLGSSLFVAAAVLVVTVLLAQSRSAGDPAAAAQSFSAGGADQDSDDENQGPGTAARIRVLDGTADIERYEDDSTDEATLNAPLFAGDTVRTQGRGRVEIQLATGTLVRLDEDSRVSFMSVPGANGGGDEATLLQLSDGSLEIEIRGGAPRKGDFQIDTAAASVYLLADGRYRIDIQDRKGGTRVSAYRGVAEVVGDEGSVIVRSAHRTFVEDGGEPDEPGAFNTASADVFDGWIADRSAEARRASRGGDGVDEEQIPEQVRPYESELSAYGRWTTVPSYGLVWVPSGMGPSWRPYYNGYWAYGPRGAFWVSYDPWGWAPYHYGRWNWYTGFGWVWVPGSVFSGAWVSWYYGPTYVGWCPLDYYDYPCWTGLGPGYGGYDFHTWNFVTYNNVYVRHVTKVYVNTTIVRNEVVKGTGVVVRRPVRLRPGDVRDARVAPAMVLKRAKSLGTTAVIDTAAAPRDRATPKRTFRDTERETLKAVEVQRRPARPDKADRFQDRSNRQAPAGDATDVRRKPGQGREPAPGTSAPAAEGRQKRTGAASPQKVSPSGRPMPRTHGAPSRDTAPKPDRREKKRSGLTGDESAEPSSDRTAERVDDRQADRPSDPASDRSRDRFSRRSTDRTADVPADRSPVSPQGPAAARERDRDPGDGASQTDQTSRSRRARDAQRGAGTASDAPQAVNPAPSAESANGGEPDRGSDGRPSEPGRMRRTRDAEPKSDDPGARQQPRTESPRAEQPQTAAPARPAAQAAPKPAERKPAEPKQAAPKAEEKHPKDSGGSDKDKDRKP